VNAPLHIIFGAVGSGGDLNPMLAIARTLRDRGIACSVLAGEWQADLVQALGLPFHPILSERQFAAFTQHSGAAEGADGNWLAFFYDAVFPAVAPVFEAVAALHRPGRTVLLGASHVIGLRLAAERFDLPYVSTNVQPEPVRPNAADPFLRYFNGLLSRLLGQHRRAVGLGDIAQQFTEWLDADRRTVSLFPAWFPVPGLDGPAQGRMLDFIFDDPQGEPPTSRVIDAFLARHEGPLVFTAGTGNRKVREFFAAALDAAHALERPALLLTRERAQLPSPLPAWALQADYVPLGQLLPHADAIVHHGGIGTCAQALRAGIPQLVIPGGFDQFDNAARTVAFGVGERLSCSAVDETAIAQALARLLQSPTVAGACARMQRLFDPVHSLDWCCDALLEEIAQVRAR
jgi:rhamnosyltransferase subunit B